MKKRHDIEVPDTEPAADIAPVETEVKSEKIEALGSKKDEPATLIYVGPTLPSVVSHNSIFNNGLTPQLEEAIKKEPALKGLLVTPAELSDALRGIAAEEGAISIYYKKALAIRERR